MKPIYIPKGRAKEYGDYAINIYTGCPHRCYYCFAPSVLRKRKEQFHSIIQPREGIVDAVERQIKREGITGKLIHLCFTCDPYPTGYDSTATREVIKILKRTGNHVQVLTKGDGRRDMDLLDGGDWFGISYSCHSHIAETAEPYAVDPVVRKEQLAMAKEQGVKTWISFEPVISAGDVFECIEECRGLIDKVKIGKLNYHPSGIDWKQFGEQVETLCKSIGMDCYIKDSLRKEMEKSL